MSNSIKVRPNIIVLHLDGVRNDRLHISPELMEISKEGTFFDNIIASSPYTIASVQSILTGMTGSKNGVDGYYNVNNLKSNVKTLTEYLKNEGYSTSGDIVNESVLNPRGFDTINVHDEFNDDLIDRHKEAIDISSKSSKNFFLYLQYSGLHAGMVKNIFRKYDDFSDDFFNNPERNCKIYDEYLLESGQYASRIYRHLINKNLDKNTIILVYSDHGMSLGEKKGERAYGVYVYDYTVKTFLFMIHKNVFPRKKLNNLVKMIDIMPTILDILNIPLDPNFLSVQGDNLKPLIRKKWNFWPMNYSTKVSKYAYIETGGLHGPWPSPKTHNVKAIRDIRWKLIHNEEPNTWELYDLKTDSNEKNNIFGEKKDIEHRLMHAKGNFEDTFLE